MVGNQNIPILGHNRIRRTWHKDQWFYSVLDVISALTDSKRPDVYWLALKKRLKNEEFNEAVVQIEYLKLDDEDGQYKYSVAANRKTLLRLIQSIPSSKAMPLHQWLAQVGEERLEEIENYNRLLERMKAAYIALGYDQEWIEQNIRNIAISNYLLNDWQDRGVNQIDQLDKLIREIYKGAFGLHLPVAPEDSLLPARPVRRRNMSYIEFALISLGESIASMLHKDNDSQGFEAIYQDITRVGSIVGEMRQIIENSLGKRLDSPVKNYPAGAPGSQLSMFDEMR